jgi:hypothetical protein
MNKKEWLDYLYYDVGKQQYDFFVCGLKKFPDGEVKATKWKKYSEICFPLNPEEYKKIDWVNQRQILPNELVLDIENPDELGDIIKRLKKEDVSYKCYSTGSRGYHIHIFFKREWNEEAKIFFIEKL